MEVESITSENDKLHVIIKGAHPAFVNAIRRIIMADLYIPAIDKVYIAENTSVLYDEIIAHRLRMIPLRGGENLNIPEKCSCNGKGCPFCEVALSLDVEAKENFSIVYSGRLKSEGNVYPVNNDIPIVKLNAGQKISLVAYARLGKGRYHAKWQPVSICVVKYEPVISINENCDLCGICVEKCLKKVLEIKENKLVVKSIWACSLCKVCEEVCPKAAIKVSYNDRSARLTLETTGSRTNEELLLMACNYLAQRCGELREIIKSIMEGVSNGKENTTN
ncbi:MAG: DNA-directed RNA polymerase subunit D [Candidatus Methanomethyliaceae archaeon]|nr:DNA-directed RNA polymerase subunit D [Candidatus Methanomethyliaceae archaeon]